VVGLLASRLKERHHRPAIIFADGGDGLLKRLRPLDSGPALA